MKQSTYFSSISWKLKFNYLWITFPAPPLPKNSSLTFSSHEPMTPMVDLSWTMPHTNFIINYFIIDVRFGSSRKIFYYYTSQVKLHYNNTLKNLIPGEQYEIRIATSSRYHTHYSHLGPRFRLRKFSLTSCGCGCRNHIFVAGKEWRAVILKIMWELQFLHNLYLDVFGYFFSSEEPKLHTVFCTVYQSAIGWDRQWHKMTSVKVI